MKKDKNKPKRNLNLEDWEEWSDDDMDFEDVTDMEDQEENSVEDGSSDIEEDNADDMETEEADDEYSEYRDALDDDRKFNWHYIFLVVIDRKSTRLNSSH